MSRLATKEKVAASSQNQALAALLFLYKNILGLTIKTPENIVRAKKPKKLPAVLSREETAKIFSLLPTNDYSLFIRLLYGMGMQPMEALWLRIQDIDFEKNEITVHCGKELKTVKPYCLFRLNFHCRNIWSMSAASMRQTARTVLVRCRFLLLLQKNIPMLVKRGHGSGRFPKHADGRIKKPANRGGTTSILRSFSTPCMKLF